MGYTHTMEYFPGIKVNEKLIQATIWINLENVMLIEGSHTKCHLSCDCIYMKYPE